MKVTLQCTGLSLLSTLQPTHTPTHTHSPYSLPTHTHTHPTVHPHTHTLTLQSTHTLTLQSAHTHTHPTVRPHPHTHPTVRPRLLRYLHFRKGVHGSQHIVTFDPGDLVEPAMNQPSLPLQAARDLRELLSVEFVRRVSRLWSSH